MQANAETQTVKKWNLDTSVMMKNVVKRLINTMNAHQYN